MNTRFLWVMLCVAGCGPTEQTTSAQCGPASCNGCCDANQVCQPGVTTNACGQGGATCSVCVDACTAGACVAKPDPEPFPADAKFVFTSSLGLQGNFGGRARADEHCNNLAQAAGLTGTFAAWLSGRPVTNGVSENARDFVTGEGPWYLTCRDDAGKLRKPFANRAALLTAPSTPLNCDEKGAAISTWVWTGTDIGGVAAQYAQCANYDSLNGNSASWLYLADYSAAVGSYDTTGSAGFSGQTDERWTSAGGQTCKTRLSFYCFQL